MQIIPFKEPAAWQAQITFSNIIYQIYIRWNALNKYWVLNIYDRNSEPILLGIKIVTNYNLTEQFSALLGMPPGDVICQNILDLWDDIQRFDMGETTELIYYEENEIDTLATI